MGVSAYEFSLDEYPALQESIHHNFSDDTTRMVLDWDDKARLVAVWPPNESEEDPFFYLMTIKDSNYVQLPNINKVCQEFEQLGVIPVLSPIEHTEQLLGEKYVRLNVSSRLSSRHLRNQLKILKDNGEFTDFSDYAADWMNEIEISEPTVRLGEKAQLLDVYYREVDSSGEKELVWSGDGIQIWLQILLHMYRSRNSSVIILDEPEVYLHSDLQRRLVRLLEGSGKQVIMATHSPEIIAETSPGNIVMVDKTRKRGLRMKDEFMLDGLTRSVGTSFNLRLVRALKSKVVLFVEGKDMKLLRKACAILNLSHLEKELNITVIPLDGKSENKNVIPFQLLNEKMLSNTKSMYVILDRDYQTEEQCVDLEKKFSDANIQAHVWRRKELESYFINTQVISRITGSSVDEIDDILLKASEELKEDTLARIIGQRLDENRRNRSSKDTTTITREAQKELNDQWTDIDGRIKLIAAKEMISKINQHLSQQGLVNISDTKLVSSHGVDEIPTEMANLLKAIDAACS